LDGNSETFAAIELIVFLPPLLSGRELILLSRFVVPEINYLSIFSNQTNLKTKNS
jgi:hypothetical protein